MTGKTHKHNQNCDKNQWMLSETAVREKYKNNTIYANNLSTETNRVYTIKKVYYEHLISQSMGQKNHIMGLYP